MEVARHIAVPGSRAVYSVEAPTFTALAERLSVPSRHFVLLIAADTRSETGTALVDAAEKLVRRGASYACCWGPDSERLEACFDEADIFVRGADSEGVVMTTAHADETLEEAVWFAVNTAWPTAEFEDSTTAVVAATVGAPAWAAEVRRYLDAGAPMSDEA